MTQTINPDVWSEFEIAEQYIKTGEAETYEDMSCVGTAEHQLDTHTVTKKCRGKVVKQRTKGKGTGTLNEKLHVPAPIYNKMYAMSQEDLIDGVQAYGEGSRHPEFSLTALIENEDGDKKYRAYPRCVITNGPKSAIENGAEEVPELELEIALLPDKYGNCMYEATVATISEEVGNKWLKEFKPELVHITSA